MARENRFVIMLDEDERQAIEALALVERLPASTLARQRLLVEAERRGMMPSDGKANRASQVLADSSAIAA